jgi:hypothetical protein
MTIVLSAAFNGATMPGFTSPTYTPSADRAPDASNGLQYAITAVGGTQVGVTAHSASSPFTMTFVRPKNLKKLGVVNPVTGVLPNVPKNQWVFIFRKGVTPLAGQPAAVMTIRTTIDVPAGADVADPANIKAALSAMMGQYAQQSSGIAESIISGLI